MKTRTVLCAAAMLAGAIILTSNVLRAAPPQLRGPPAGVAGEQWIPISDSLGFVIQADGVARGERNLNGYFMVKRIDGWWRLNARTASGIEPAVALQHLTSR